MTLKGVNVLKCIGASMIFLDHSFCPTSSEGQKEKGSFSNIRRHDLLLASAYMRFALIFSYKNRNSLLKFKGFFGKSSAKKTKCHLLLRRILIALVKIILPQVNATVG